MVRLCVPPRFAAPRAQRSNRYTCLAGAVPVAEREQERVEPCSAGALLG